VSYTIGDLHETLGKMKLAADLLKDVRESVAARVASGEVTEPLDEATQSKLVRALGLHEEVNDFMTSVRRRDLAPAPTLRDGDAEGDEVRDRSMRPGSDESDSHPADTASQSGALRIEKRRYHFADDQLVLGHDLIEARAEGKWFTGRVLDVVDGKVVQSVGRGIAAIHEASHLDKVPLAGDAVSIIYHKGRGNVLQLTVSRARDIGHGSDSSPQHDTAG
jgi:hypothetical protein